MFPLTLVRPADSRWLSLELTEGPPERLRRGDSTPAYPSILPTSKAMYPSSSLRRAQEGSSRSSRAAVNKQEAGGRGVQLAGASVRFPCPGGCPPSPRQQELGWHLA